MLRVTACIPRLCRARNLRRRQTETPGRLREHRTASAIMPRSEGLVVLGAGKLAWVHLAAHTRATALTAAPYSGIGPGDHDGPCLLAFCIPGTNAHSDQTPDRVGSRGSSRPIETNVTCRRSETIQRMAANKVTAAHVIYRFCKRRHTPPPLWGGFLPSSDLDRANHSLLVVGKTNLEQSKEIVVV
jgi:hypothetical protein